MYGYRIYLYAVEDPIRTANETKKITLLYPWNNRYLELVGFIKNQKPIPIHSLELKENLAFLRGASPVFIQLNGNIKTLSYKVKEVERIKL